MERTNNADGPTFAQQHTILTDLTSRLLLTRDIVGVLNLVTRAVYDMLKYEDCVIYLHKNGKLTQWVAAGPKKLDDGSISNPLTLMLGEGIVGAAAADKQTQLIMNTARDNRYIEDDASRGSELAVPILSAGETIGVIDSEHELPGFYTERDAEMLECIAKIIALPLNEALNGYSSLEHREQDLRLASDALDSLTSTDDMTGIKNRRAFTKHLATAKEQNRLVCCAVFDMDGFKQINDNYGHHCGDDAIIRFVALLRINFPHGKSDHTLARLGGDEFGVICPIEDAAGFVDKINTLILQLQSNPIFHNNEPIALSGSSGVAFGDADTVWLRADEALYRAKAMGKNQVAVDEASTAVGRALPYTKAA